ncbi:TetR/AcrR family transcriptional regulator [Nocardia sp. NPDC052566]|uniref:TetR/AcrR family transcriptional regulator n=1 Tax=Nocardia sp. NPDC052566 TaxID=3364330 RepID=UPI0037CB60B1
MAERGRPRGFDREAALRGAMEMFWTHGYEGTSIADLAALMGIRVASLYAAFGSKQELFRESVQLYSRTVMGSAAESFAVEPGARNAIERWLRMSAEAFTAPRTPSGCLVTLSALTTSPKNDPVRTFLTDVRRQTRAAIAVRLERARREGELPGTVDTAGLAAYFTTVAVGMAIQARDGVDRTTLDLAIDYAMAVWDRLVAPIPH